MTATRASSLRGRQCPCPPVITSGAYEPGQGDRPRERTSDSNVTPMRRHPRTVTTADVRDAHTALRRAQVRAMELPAALGLVAQSLYRRHPALVSGLVLCSIARNARGSPAEQLAALAVPAGGRRAALEPDAPP